MLNPRRIYDLLHTTPFEPLVFTFSDGSRETIKHPENAYVTTTSINIAKFSSDEKIPDWFTPYSWAHVLKIEPVQSQSA